MQKPTRFYEKEEAPTISVGSFRPGDAPDREVLNRVIIQMNSKKGYIFQEDKQVQIGTDGGHCLLFSRGKSQMNMTISCYSLADQLFLDFFSHGSDTQTFYAVVSQIRRPGT